MDRINCGSQISVKELVDIVKNDDYQCPKLFYKEVKEYNKATGDIAKPDDVYFHDHSTKPMPINLLPVLLYINDIDIFLRIVGMRSIEFVELKAELLNEPFLQESWKPLYSPIIVKNISDDVSFNVKVITIHLIRQIVQVVITTQNHLIMEVNLTEYTVNRLCVLLGWRKITPKIREKHGKAVADIINFALKKLNLSVTCCAKKYDRNIFNIPFTLIHNLIPDIDLFLQHNYINNNPGSSYFKISSNKRNIQTILYRKFVTVQLHPYQFGHNEYAVKLKSVFFNLSESNVSLYQEYRVLNHEIMEYKPNTWSDIVIHNLGNLSYQGKQYLSIDKVAGDKKLYEQLIGIPSDFFDYIVDNQSDLFYGTYPANIFPKPVENL